MSPRRDYYDFTIFSDDLEHRERIQRHEKLHAIVLYKNKQNFIFQFILHQFNHK